MHIRGANLFAAAVTAAIGLAGTIAAATPARAQVCPGNPNALGTSRVLAIDPGEYQRVGTMQYPQTLPLDDHEVVLTFDDGPLPPNSNKILDILASQCVKATYFLIGSMAHEFPDVVRRIHEAGHTIGTHSENHPINIRKLPDERVRQEIEEGIASVGAALGDPAALAPFFRIPGLERSDTIDEELDAHSLVTFSADVVADDWHRHITPGEIIARAMSRLEAKGKGILLLHDIHPWTVAALPGLFKELKEHGFHIVQVVPAGPSEPQMIAGPTELTVAWTMAGQDVMDDSGDKPSWPKFNVGATPDPIELPAPDADAFDVSYSLTAAASIADIEVNMPSADAGSSAMQWPDQSQSELPSSGPQLPAPSVQDIGWPVVAGRRVVDEQLKLRPSLDMSIDHGRPRHVRLNAHRRARAPAAAGQHADIFAGIRALAALMTPAR
jgi:peptidoglycan/xylan/chitin deacetylase (PgdA/CDA1 family)